VGRLGLTEVMLVLALLFLVFAEYFIAFVAKRVLRPRKQLPASPPPTSSSEETGP